MNLTYSQRRTLASRGIVVLIEYAKGPVKCLTAQGVRYYTAEDLQQRAAPSMAERVRAWFGGYAA